MFKKSFILVLALMAAVGVRSQNVVVLNPTIDPDYSNGDYPRSPILVPVLYLDGYTLTASDNTLGSTIRILDADDNVVFSTYVAIEGDINLPTTLCGTYTIEVVFDNVTFVGEIEL